MYSLCDVFASVACNFYLKGDPTGDNLILELLSWKPYSS